MSAQIEAMQRNASKTVSNEPISLLFSCPYAAGTEKPTSQPQKLVVQECWRPLAGDGSETPDISAELIGNCLDAAHRFKSIGIDYWYLMYFKQELAEFLCENTNFLFACRSIGNDRIKMLREHLQSISSLNDYSHETSNLRRRFGKIAITFYAWYRCCINWKYLFCIDNFFHKYYGLARLTKNEFL